MSIPVTESALRNPRSLARVWAVLATSIVATVTLSGCQNPLGPITVPDQYLSYFTVAAKRCPGVLTPELLAGQAWTESSFDPSTVSPAGAEGLMQIIPEVWARYGTDADGNGRADPFNPADSIATAAKFNCIQSNEVRPIPGNNTKLMLAAYNAGLGAVQKYRGIPPYAETEDYVTKVLNARDRVAPQFSKSPSSA
ncbi:MAG: lytic transglycosylase domain-containing protein [Candidatus Nanopelagicales bacterium]